MTGYIFEADLWCEDCGKAILDKCTGVDDGSMPQEVDVSGESDTPQHCGAGPDCINAIVFDDGCKIGCWLENELTSDGVDYVNEHAESPSEVTDLWLKWYEDYEGITQKFS